MDLYEESCAAKNHEGPSFITLYRLWVRLVYRPTGSFETGFQQLDISNTTRMITIATDNFVKLQELLNKQSNVILSKKLFNIFWDSLLLTTQLVMRLFVRNKLIPNILEMEQAMTKQKLEEIIKKIEYIISKPMNYKRPVQFMITQIYIQSAWFDETLDNEICKMLLDCIPDLDVLDHEGNTILLFAASLMLNPQCNISRLLNLINSLICRGAYIYAKNNEEKAVIDYVTEFVKANEENEEGQTLLQLLKN